MEQRGDQHVAVHHPPLHEAHGHAHGVQPVGGVTATAGLPLVPLAREGISAQQGASLRRGTCGEHAVPRGLDVPRHVEVRGPCQMARGDGCQGLAGLADAGGIEGSGGHGV